jgi:hypothetical protein
LPSLGFFEIPCFEFNFLMFQKSIFY